MFIFGTDSTTRRAWPIHAIRSVMFNSGKEGRKDELAIHLTDGTTAWLRDKEAREIWKQIVEKGIGARD